MIILGIRLAIKAGSNYQPPATSTPTPTADGPNTSISTTPSTPVTSNWSNGPMAVILNSAQLEKELMRMFANACMYNKSTSQVAKEAREMCRDVDNWVANF